MRTIIITYDPKQDLNCNGEELDLYDYLLNELRNAGIIANIREVDQTSASAQEPDLRTLH